MISIKICIVGLGCVGKAMMDSFQAKKIKLNKYLFVYDKYKDRGIGNIKNCLMADIVFLCLPTPYSKKLKQYNKSEIYSICKYLSNNNYKGLVVIKSTVEPETTENISKKYVNLNLIHNPEFLSEKTAYKDFHNQKHIIIGKIKKINNKQLNVLKDFYKTLYPKASISICTATESECVKIFCNTFYAVKIQFFTELYLLCQKNNTDFVKIVEMMLANKWINAMHTKVPGSDKQISYGGACFTKDTKALNSYMIKKKSCNKVLDATIEERDSIRKDQINCE